MNTTTKQLACLALAMTLIGAVPAYAQRGRGNPRNANGTSSSSMPMGRNASTTVTQATRRVFGTTAAMPALSDAVSTPSLAKISSTAVDPLGNNSTLRLNFKGSNLQTVLQYLSQQAGFTILQDDPFNSSDKLDVVSLQPVTPSEAVNIVNSALIPKGFAAIRNGKELHIMTIDHMRIYKFTPVATGTKATDIPIDDTIVTQIMPMKNAIAMRILENLRTMVDPSTPMTANESSNALIVTDTQSNIKRIAKIVEALDTAVVDKAQLKVYQLNNADAVSLAQTINTLFQSNGGGNQGGRGGAANGRGGRGGPGGGAAGLQMMMAMSGLGGAAGGPTETGNSEARNAASRVSAVADQRTNALIVVSGSEYLPIIEQLIKEVDVEMQDLTVISVFPLLHADATDMANTITSVFADPTGGSTGNTGARGQANRAFGNQRGNRGGGGGSATSERKLEEARVVAIPDIRTNSVIVSASKNSMDLVGQMIHDIDSDPAKAQKVFVYNLDNADASQVVNLLSGIFPGAGGTTNRNTSNRNTTGRGGTSNTSTRNRSSNSGGGGNSGGGFGSGAGGGFGGGGR